MLQGLSGIFLVEAPCQVKAHIFKKEIKKVKKKAQEKLQRGLLNNHCW